MSDLVTYKAPWGGVNSSLPEDKIESGDFPFMSNFIIRDGEVRTRPTMLDPSFLFTGLTVSHINQQILAVGFRNVTNGGAQGRTFFITSLGSLYEEDTVNGYLLKGTTTFTSNVGLIPYIIYNNILYAAVGNGEFKWDGATFTSPIGGWVCGGFFIGVLANHGVIASTQEGANSFPQRIRWSAVGNLDVWNPATDNTAGIQDLLEVDDFITGLMINTAGVGLVLRSTGLTQMIATGSGSKPWDFYHILNKGAGCIYYGSGDSYADWSVYVGLDDIYSVDSAGGLGRIGGKAKSKIFADIASIPSILTPNNNPPLVKIVPNIIGSIIPVYRRGYPYLSYVLAIPQGGTGGTPPSLSTIFWVYYKDLNLWERFTASNGWLQCKIRSCTSSGVISTLMPMYRAVQTS